MHTRTWKAVAAGAAVTALLLTGCSSRPEKADTVSGPPATSSATPDPTTSPTPSEAPVVARVALTQEQIAAALLTAEDLPAGWTVDPDTGEEAPEDETPTGAVYDPPACAEIAGDLGEEPSDEQPVAEGSVSFSSPTPAFLSQQIQTWESDLDDDGFDELVAALDQCAQFTQTDPDGTVTTSTVTALDIPNHGDRTLAVRLASTSGTEAFQLTLTVDLVIVAAGDTSVALMAGAFQPLDPAVLAEVTATAMRKVDAVS